MPMSFSEESAKPRLSFTDRRGTAAIEFALIVPLLVTLLLCCAEIGYFVYQSMLVNSAVESGAMAAKQEFNATAVTSAILTGAGLPGIQASPAPSLFCGCVVRNTVVAAACDSKCSGNLVPGHYALIGARLTPQSIMPGNILPLPTTIAVQTVVRLN